MRTTDMPLIVGLNCCLLHNAPVFSLHFKCADDDDYRYEWVCPIELYLPSLVQSISCCCVGRDFLDDMVVLLVGHRTCDSQVAGSSPGWAPPRSGLAQANYTCVPLSPSSIIWYQPKGLISLDEKVTACLVESNGSLPPGL